MNKNKEHLSKCKEMLAAFHRGNRDEEKEAQGGALPFKHKLIEEEKNKNPKKSRREAKNNLRKVVNSAREDY
ncbi:MAG: hypothetical protein MJ212_05045 [Alphaproteobacteria bacterium]|nr:hypothetical protein [Alphaproteobacteria bacterium]